MSSFQERINKLSDQQKLLLAKQLSAKNTAETNENNKQNKKIVAYITADNTIEQKKLVENLKGVLPEYMIPSKFVQLDEFPKLPNGKFDLNSLKLPTENELLNVNQDATSAKNVTEKQLIKIWEEVLAFQPIRRNDNFFEIGGDSILSIQIVSKARQNGIFLAPNQIFEHQTISELALFAKTEEKFSDEEEIFGNLALLPIQHWFFEEHKNAPNHWNQAIIFNSQEKLDSVTLKKSIEYLIEYHPTLRLQFEQKGDCWNSFVAKPKDVNAFEVFDITNVPREKIKSELRVRSIEFQSKLNLSNSALFQVKLFVTQEGSKLFIFAHHLLVDNVSWQLLISDLETIYRQLSSNRDIELPGKTSSYKKWGEHLIELSKSGEFDGEVDFWNEQIESGQIPTDFDVILPVFEESVQTIDLELDSMTTEKLLINSNETYKTRRDELIIVSLLLAFEKWAKIKNLCIGLEKHGRKYHNNDLDFSRSLGWFTTYFPVVLKVEDVTNLESVIIETKEKLRKIPNEGIGFGALRYLQKLDGLTQKPQVIFNYLGYQKPFTSELFGNGEFLSEDTRSPKSERHHLIEINAYVQENKLKFRIGFSEKLHRRETVQKLTELIKNGITNVIDRCSRQESSVYSPSDFPEANLNQADLDNLLEQIS